MRFWDLMEVGKAMLNFVEVLVTMDFGFSGSGLLCDGAGKRRERVLNVWHVVNVYLR